MTTQGEIVKGTGASKLPNPSDRRVAFSQTVTDAASVTLATAPSGREGKQVSIINDGANPVYVAFGEDATVANGLKLLPDEVYNVGGIAVADVRAICATGENANVRGILWCGLAD